MFCSRTAEIDLLVTAVIDEDGSFAIITIFLSSTNGLIHSSTSNEFGSERCSAQIRV